MFTPEQMGEFPEYFVKLFEEYDAFVIEDFSRRVAKAGTITSTAEWQAMRAQEIGLSMDTLTEKSAVLLGITQDELKDMFDDAGASYISSEENRLGVGTGLSFGRIIAGKTLQRYISAAYKQTNESFKNITGTTATGLVIGGKYHTMKSAYTMALDLAQMQVSSGVLDYETAVRHAIRSIAKLGVSTLADDSVRYDSGAHLSVRAAARMCVLTGVNQMARWMNDAIADDLQLDLVEVTAHAGARPSHAVWQGGIYSRSGKSKKYPNLYDVTGLGTGAGLCGWNCRHNYYGYYEGSPRVYTSEYMAQLRKVDAQTFTYDGKEYNTYEASQRQRQLERQIIATKRELIGYDAIEDKEAYQIAAVRLRKQREKYKDFSNTAGLRLKWERSQQDGYDRRLSGKTTWANRQVNTLKSKLIKAKKTSTGVNITDIAPHLAYRAKERGISSSSIVQALTAPLDTGKIRTDGSQQFIGESATVVINVNTGKVITVWATSTKKAEQLKRKKG